MKKYLAKCLVAVSVMGMVSSCAHDEETSIYNEVQSNYIQAFNNTFGTPAEDQDWGFDQVMTSEARTTRAMGDYNGYKGSMQPVEWYQDTNDGWQWKTRIYTFPSAPEFPTSRPSNAEYYSGGYKYFNGGSFYMDENTSKHVEIQGYCDMYVVKSGTGSGNVTIESTSKWYVGNVPYGSGQKIRIFVCPGVTLKIPENDAAKHEANLQADVEYYFAPGSNLVCEAKLKLNGTAIYMAGNTTTTVPELEVNNNGIFYNVGTANIAGTISVENNNSIVVNDGVLNATNLYTKGSGRVQNNAELTLSNYTIINSNYNIWVNNGHYRTKYFAYTATSSSVINNCYLKVDEDFMMNIADGSGDFKIDAGGGVLTKNFYGGGKFVAKDNNNKDVTFNGGPFKITMGSKAVFKVTETASLNALASAIATAHYGFEGVGSEYAVFQAKNVIKEGLGEGNVAYSGNLYVSAENHFAQGYSGQYPYIHYYNGCSEKNIYASGFESGKPAITIDPTPCNPGFEGKASENFDVRIIAEDLTATQGSDFDFNDVVFDVTFTSETTATITLQAAGGTLPLTVAGQNVHDLFNAAESEMINTNAPARNGGVTRDPVSFDVTGINRANRGKDIRVMVKKNGNWIELIANKGVAAAKIAVKPTFEWCDEYQDIQNKYPKFADWVKNKEVIWYE